ncbi:unnamed protein product [Ambrosiozyma monospora]|uniref:Unnamed protein product n=1 Tax=Ambrosiozyma monospora TaxID=43982 RepID=A0ACB5SYU8_AMBMO|nr:unnamed protein product [Ambrosiozyma monospora]
MEPLKKPYPNQITTLTMDVSSIDSINKGTVKTDIADKRPIPSDSVYVFTKEGREMIAYTVKNWMSIVHQCLLKHMLLLLLRRLKTI